MYVVVLGGGFVGQMVQFAVPTARVLDARKTPPRRHLETRVGPQYLWEPIPGVPSHSFPVCTLVDGLPPTPESILAYKIKIGKESDGGDWGLQFQHQTVGWHSELPAPSIDYDQQITDIDLPTHRLHTKDGVTIQYDVLVNTIPLHLFLTLCVPTPIIYAPWRFDPIYMVATKQTPVAFDGMQLNYLSDHPQYYRETVHDDHLYYESLHWQPDAWTISPGKIHPHPDSERLVRALRTWGVFCFGRFATWRPDELAHETWKHIAAWRKDMNIL